MQTVISVLFGKAVTEVLPWLQPASRMVCLYISILHAKYMNRPNVIHVFVAFENNMFRNRIFLLISCCERKLPLYKQLCTKHHNNLTLLFEGFTILYL